MSLAREKCQTIMPTTNAAKIAKKRTGPIASTSLPPLRPFYEKDKYMSLAQRLSEYISAAFSGLWIESHEHADALREIAQLCHDQNWRLAKWDIEQGLQISGQNNQPADAGGNDPLAAIR